MDLALFERKSEYEWHIKPFGKMHVPGVIFASESLLREMDVKVYEQVTNVAMLPGIVEASWAMPDAHWGYGFPIGGVAAFDAEASPRAAWASTFLAACAPCIPVCVSKTSKR